MLPHVEPGADVLEIPRAVELDDLVRVADAGIEVGDLPPVARLEAALLDQLALRHAYIDAVMARAHRSRSGPGSTPRTSTATALAERSQRVSALLSSEISPAGGSMYMSFTTRR